MIKDRILDGLPLDDIFVCDIHAHYGKGNTTFMLDSDADGILSSCDRLGVDKICVSAISSISGDYKLGNDMVQKVAAEYPGRIYGYVCPTPYYDYDLSEYFKPGSGIIGIKIHALLQQSEIKNSGYYAAYELADKLSLPILFHAWEQSEAVQATEVAAKYKNAKIILGHSGMTEIGAKMAAIEGCKKYENIFIDTAISATYEGAIEWIVSKVGADRIVYGSDVPYFDCRQTFGKLGLSKISEKDKIKIYGENAKKILSL